MLPRTITALIGLLILLGVLWAGVPWIALMVLLVVALGIREFYRLIPPNNFLANSGADSGADPGVNLVANPGGALADNPTAELVSPSQDPALPPASVTSPPAASTPALPLPMGLIWGAAFSIGGLTATGPAHFLLVSLTILAAGAFAALLWLIAFYRGNRWPATAAYLAGGPVYVGFLLAHVLLLAQIGSGGDDIGRDASYYAGYALGRNWILFALLVTFATDTCAYLVGRAIGQRRMAPSISPGKTWEGASGGFIGAVATAMALDYFLSLGLDQAALNWQVPLIGATVGVAAQAGDLWESKLKRWAGVKDSGRLLLGHGGILDRLDSLLITIPVTYYLACWAL